MLARRDRRRASPARVAAAPSTYARGVDPVLPALDGASVAGIVPALFGRVDDAWIPELGPVRRRGRAARARRSRLERGAGSRAVDAAPRRRWRVARSRRSRRRPRRPRSRRSRPAWRPRSTASSATGCSSATRCSTCCAGRPSNRGRLPGAERRAAVRAVPRPRGSGRHPHRVPRHRVHARAPARYPARRLAHDGRSGRAVRARGRSGREVRLRVLPGDRHDRARVRACTTACSRTSSRSPTGSSASSSTRCPRARRCSSRRITGRSTSKPSRGSTFPSSARVARAMAGDGRFRYLYAAPGGARELLAAARELVSDRAWVWSRSELLDMGVFGARRDRERCPGRIGNVVLAAREPVAFVDPALPERAQRCSRGTAASRPTRCTCRCSRRTRHATRAYASAAPRSRA